MFYAVSFFIYFSVLSSLVYRVCSLFSFFFGGGDFLPRFSDSSVSFFPYNIFFPIISKSDIFLSWTWFRSIIDFFYDSYIIQYILRYFYQSEWILKFDINSYRIWRRILNIIFQLDNLCSDIKDIYLLFSFIPLT